MVSVLAFVLWFLYFATVYPGASIVFVVSRSYPYSHLQQPAPLQGLPLHLVNGIDCEKYLRNSGGLRC